MSIRIFTDITIKREDQETEEQHKQGGLSVTDLLLRSDVI